MLNGQTSNVNPPFQICCQPETPKLTLTDPNLHLSPEERRLFGQLFAQADAGKIGVVTGEDAVKFFEKTRLSSDVLGEIWQIADTENRGLLTPAGFGMVLRLIGYAQAGRPVSKELALKPGGPLPKFDGITAPAVPPSSAAPLQAQNSGPIRVPPLTAEKVSQYVSLFEESGAHNGALPGETAKTIFERANLPNEVLGRIWALADTEQKGFLGLTEFVIAMHLLASMKNGSMRALPQILPAGLYEAAARRGAPRQTTGSRPTSTGAASTIPRQFSGQGYPGPQKVGTGFQQPVPTGDQWVITPQDKAQFDQVFATVDIQNRGFITGEQAVGFFSNSRLPEEALAQIWDLADINSEGQLSKDEFAVAMYLIRQQRSKTTGRDILPQQLPPNLVPPSMRRQPVAPQQPTAPAFNNAVNITGPKPASEDLFGLDAFSSAPSNVPLQATSTGDSSVYSTPLRNQASPPSTSQASLHFKPFVPSSTFGQTIMTPQGTGTSGSASPATSRGFARSQKQSTPLDDLLGDNDPEVSEKLTSETSDLANLSNQVSSLTGQMQNIKTKRVMTEQELSRAQSSKGEFETRLSQLRAAYEQEVKEVQALEERLSRARSETRKLQSDMAMLLDTQQDLINQHRQIGESLDADQKENTNIKEKIRQASTEIEQLKPALEKMRSDARHQKGLVAINRKQLATYEAEKEKIRGDMSAASAEHDEAKSDLEQTQREIESSSQTQKAPAAVASPTTSSTSLNPFLRRSSNVAIEERGAVSLPFTPPSAASPNHNAFDSFFSSSAAAPSTGPPPTSFRSEPPSVLNEKIAPQAASNQSSDGAGIATPPASPPVSNFSDSPPIPTEPPPPPQSRQMTSSFLPLRPNLERSGSESSSVKAVPPTSQISERSETPKHVQSVDIIPRSPKQHFLEFAAKEPPQDEPLQMGLPSSEQTLSLTLHERAVPGSSTQTSGPVNATRDLPGAFPSDETPTEKPQPNPLATPYSDPAPDPRVHSVSRSEIPMGNQATTPHSIANAFEGISRNEANATITVDHFEPTNKGKDAVHGNGAVTGSSIALPAPLQSHGEFPPIEEFGGDDESDSDSDSERGAEDDFSHRSVNETQESGPSEALQAKGPMGGQVDGLSPSRPPLKDANSNLSQLPTPGAQASPPTYDQTIGLSNDDSSHPKESTQFPAEYTGLLPSRNDPISLGAPPSQSTTASKGRMASPAGVDRGFNFLGESSEQGTGHAKPASTFSQEHSPMAPGASNTAPYAYTQTSPPPQPSQTSPPVPSKTEPRDEFDFDDLAPAQEEGTRADDELDDSQRNIDFDDSFNPTFDSPSISHTQDQSYSSKFPHSGSFPDIAGSASTTGNDTAPSQQKQQVTHDWDAIFAGLDAPQNNDAQPELPPRGQGFMPATSLAPKGTGEGSKAPSAPLEESADDDPILKRLIGMGFSRGASVQALGKWTPA
ncbi:MAG: hypothetical protein Q9163_001264 [Psora crenata]